MAALKREIIERQEKLNRPELPENYIKTFQDGITGRCNYGYGFSLEDALNEKFHDKEYLYRKIKCFLDELNISSDNAFLARQKNRTFKQERIM